MARLPVRRPYLKTLDYYHKMGRLSLFVALLAAANGALGGDWKGELKNMGGVKYQCKCYSDNKCFPKATDWAALNKTVGGTLQRALPPGAPCHKAIGSINTYDAKACADVQANWLNEQYLYVELKRMAGERSQLSELTTQSQICGPSTPTTPVYQPITPIRPAHRVSMERMSY